MRAGGRVSADEALELYHHAPLTLLGELADGIRARKHPDGIVTYIIDRNVNYTNVCVARCNFCAFYRPVGSGEGYVLGFEEIFRKIDETIALGGVQLLLQGGHNPDLPIEWYEDLFRAVKQRYPAFKLHALSPPEVIHLTRMSRLTVPEVIDRLMAAGLDSIPGGGAEILVDRVRKLLNCYGKATADEWLDVMRQAHLKGLRTTATMMYGHVETVEERLEHMVRLREVQDETGGFTAFITWSYQPEHTELGGGEATGLEYLRMLALARIVLDNFPSLQASWVTQGGKVGQLSLAYGSNDMGSVMIEENVVRAAGASYCMDEVEIVRNIENAGFVAKRRNMHYDILGDPFFREQDVPRQLSLATARADGDTSRPRSCANYAARSASEKKLAQSRHLALTRPHQHRDDCPRYRAAWVLPIVSTGRSPAAIAVTRRPRHLITAVGRVRRRRRWRTSATSPFCRASSTPTPISSSRGCAARCRRATSMPAWAASLMALRRRRRSPDPRRADRRRDPEARAAGTCLRRRRHQHPRHLRAADGQRAVGGALSRADRVLRAGSGGGGGRGVEARSRT